jgi:hypothetical protein
LFGLLVAALGDGVAFAVVAAKEVVQVGEDFVFERSCIDDLSLACGSFMLILEVV